MKSTFYREVRERIYTFCVPTNDVHCISSNILSEEILGTYDFDRLEEGDTVYLSDICKEVTIIDSVNCSNGEMRYCAKPKYVDGCNTRVSLIECFNEYKRTHPYKHRFFNFRKEY